MLINVGNIPVSFKWIDDATDQEAANYVKYVKDRVDGEIKSIEVIGLGDGKIDLQYEIKTTPFERIRRITGYLTGSLDSWNDAKQAEERDRVKHGRIE